MKKIYVFLTAFLILAFTVSNLRAQLLLNEQFNYPVGDTLSSHGWNIHSGTTFPILTTTGSLSYTGYPASAGNKASIGTTGIDVNKPFSTSITNGNIYVAALMNITAAQAAGDYFFHLMKTGTTSPLVARLYIKKDTTVIPNKFKFGFMKGSSATNLIYSSASYDFNTTHLIVLKYAVIPGSANDSTFLFINPTIGAEGIPTLVATDISQADLDTTSQAIAIRQGNAANAANVDIDEIRIANNWNEAIGYTGVLTSPSVTTLNTINITQFTASCNGSVISDGGSSVLQRGICYGTSINPDTSGTKVFATGTTGAFTANISGLSSNTTYHYRAFALNNIGLTYGADSSFTTTASAVAPVVTTGIVSSVLNATATLSGNVTSDGGSAITERGICWNTTNNPTTANFKVIVNGTTGSFSGNLTGLTGNTIYYARAYAINSVGTSYGNSINFTTLVDTISCPSIAALRSKTADNSTIYILTNEVVLNCKISNRNQKYIQDTTAAILIDDPNPAKITTVYNVGDGITGIKGKLENYYGLLEFHPIVDPGTATSTANVINPLVVTAANMLDTTFMKNHQSKLIKLNNVSFSDANGSIAFTNGKKYRITQNTTTDSLFLAYIYNIDYIGTVLPSVSGNITGVVNYSLNKYYITARNAADMYFAAILPDTAGIITGNTNVCQKQLNVTYSVPAIANATSYIWTLPNGASGTSTSNSIIVSFSNTAVSGNISVKGVNSNGSGVASSLAITVNPLPAAAGNISGQQSVCQGQTNVNYLVSNIANATSYQWNYQGTGIMISGSSNSINANFSNTASSGNIIVRGVNACGTGDSSYIAITVKAKPITPIISQNGNTLTSNASAGNQWYNLSTGLISAATSTSYLPQQIGNYFVIVTLNGCSSDTSNILYYDNTGIIGNETTKTFQIFPNPNNGKFIINFNKISKGEIKIYSILGDLIKTQQIDDENIEFDFSTYNKGIYFIKFNDLKSEKSFTEKLILN